MSPFESPNVKLLIKTFDLDVATTLHVTGIDVVNNNLVISEITVKQNGVEIRKADLNKLFLHIQNKTITVE